MASTVSPRRGEPGTLDGMHMQHTEVFLKVPGNLEPKLEQQIREYVQMRELGQQLGENTLDPTQLT